MKVAVIGYSGCGKSTIAAWIAKKNQGGHVWAGRPGRSVITFQNPENEGKNGDMGRSSV